MYQIALGVFSLVAATSVAIDTVPWKDKVLENWREYKSKVAWAQGQRDSKEFVPRTGAVLVENRCTIYQDGEYRQLLKQFTIQNKKKSNRAYVWSVNPSYGFKLASSAKVDHAWIVDGLMLGKQQTNPDFVNPIVLPIHDCLRVYAYKLEDILSDPGFSATVPEGSVSLPVAFTLVPSGRPGAIVEALKGRLHLEGRRYQLPIRTELEARYADGDVMVYDVTVEYAATEEVPLPRQQTVRRTLRHPDGTQEHIVTEMNFALTLSGPRPDRQQFYLAHFGVPEPDVPLATGNLYSWLVAVLLTTVTLSLIFLWRRRFHAIG